MVAANNFAFDFDSVLGDLEGMDSIASFPSEEPKLHRMIGARSQIDIHVDCRASQHIASPLTPPSATSIPLHFSLGAACHAPLNGVLSLC